MLAWVAIGISAAAFVWTVGWSVWLHRQTSRPSLTVTASHGVSLPGAIPCLSIQAANIGPVAVKIDSLLIRVKGQAQSLLLGYDWLQQSPGPLPVVLEPGSGHWIGLYRLDLLRQQIDGYFGPRPGRKVRADFSIAGGRRFRSTWLTL